MKKIDWNLHEAIAAEDFNEVKNCVNNGANVNAEDKYGFRPLHYAAMYGAIEIGKYLIENGAFVKLEPYGRCKQVIKFLKDEGLGFKGIVVDTGKKFKPDDVQQEI